MEVDAHMSNDARDPITMVDIQKGIQEIVHSEFPVHDNPLLRASIMKLGSRLTSYFYDLLLEICHDGRSVSTYRETLTAAPQDIDAYLMSVGPDRAQMVRAILQLAELIATTDLPVPTSVVAQHTITDIVSMINGNRIQELADDLNVPMSVHNEYASLKLDIASHPTTVSYVVAGKLSDNTAFNK